MAGISAPVFSLNLVLILKFFGVAWIAQVLIVSTLLEWKYLWKEALDVLKTQMESEYVSLM